MLFEWNCCCISIYSQLVLQTENPNYIHQFETESSFHTTVSCEPVSFQTSSFTITYVFVLSLSASFGCALVHSVLDQLLAVLHDYHNVYKATNYMLTFLQLFLASYHVVLERYGNCWPISAVNLASEGAAVEWRPY